MKNIDVRKITRKFKKFGQQEEPISMAIELLFNSYALMMDNTSGRSAVVSQEMVQIAKNNFIVNMVTALESYFKGVIISKTDWPKEGVRKFLYPNTSLGDAYEILSDIKVPREYFIAHSQSFQNLGNINEVFSILLVDKDFFNELEKVKISPLIPHTETKTFIEDQPHWKKNIAAMFEIRHQFIHDGVPTVLTEENVSDFFILVG